MSGKRTLTMVSGGGVDLLRPTVAMIDFPAIAEHIAKEKRYNGATPGVEYSVAQHSCLGADAILRWALEPADAVRDFDANIRLGGYFLLHDAKEAHLKDDTTPKKQALAELAAEEFGVLHEEIIGAFDMLEGRHDAAIHAAAGLDWPPTEDIRRAVKRCDVTMFVTEWRDLMHNRPHPNWAPYSGFQPLPEVIEAWPWQRARDEWLDRARRLLPALRGAA